MSSSYLSEPSVAHSRSLSSEKIIKVKDSKELINRNILNSASLDVLASSSIGHVGSSNQAYFKGQQQYLNSLPCKKCVFNVISVLIMSDLTLRTRMCQWVSCFVIKFHFHIFHIFCWNPNIVLSKCIRVFLWRSHPQHGCKDTGTQASGIVHAQGPDHFRHCFALTPYTECLSVRSLAQALFLHLSLAHILCELRRARANAQFL